MRGGLLTILNILLLSVLIIFLYSSFSAPKTISHESKAATICEEEGGNCYPSNYVCSGGTSSPLSCGGGYKCYFGGSCRAPTPTLIPTPKPCSGTCLPDGEEDSCLERGSGYCPSHKFCCIRIKKDPTPPPTPFPGEDCIYLYNGKCVNKHLICVPGDIIFADCPIDKKCVPETAKCAKPTLTVTPTPFPDTSCAVEGGYCYPNDWYCINGTNSGLACKTGEKCYFGGSCSGPDTGYCPLSEGLTWCTQTNSLWANNPFPYCDTPEFNKWYKRACGYASTSSILCNYVDASYCDLRYTMNAFNEYSYANCRGSAIWLHQDILEYFPNQLDIQDIGKIIPVPWKKINENLKYGPLLVGGKFKLKGKDNWIPHMSVIVKKDSRGYVWHDPYFNSDNPNPTMRVNSVYLREHMDIKLDSAMSVRPI